MRFSLSLLSPHFIFRFQSSGPVPAEHSRDKRSCYFIPHIFSIVCLISLPFALLYFKRHQNYRKKYTWQRAFTIDICFSTFLFRIEENPTKALARKPPQMCIQLLR